ncbi:5-oxoprolinase subunit PxpA [Agaribacter flavus]|uniref:5-oxoprolinase subunit PxpA n=1 Tax=Agaribacter flavus TaxID=1902781 RepID=A0ABV7FQE3_9ALTE
MKLNADLGESFGHWQQMADAEVMPYIDQANLACGYHAGDARTMQMSLALAKNHGVEIGAHPSYPDLQGFGRRSMRIPQDELMAMIHAQIATLEGMAKCQGLVLNYVKPHGALYNDMMRDIEIFEDLAFAVSQYHKLYPLMIQALADNSLQQTIASKYGIGLMYEAFADRQYKADGSLLSRQQKGAVLDADASVLQAKTLIEKGIVVSDIGTPIPLQADSICVHGDNPQALNAVKEIRVLIDSQAR